MSTAVVFVGGPRPGSDADPDAGPLRGVRPDLVVAVDSGLHLAAAHGWQADLVVGDMDSVDPDLLGAAARRGAVIERHRVDKDASDLELALDGLLQRSVDDALVLGHGGGRLDHLFGGLLVLCSPRYADLRLEAWLGGSHILVVRDRGSVRAAAGRTVSLFAVHGPAAGVQTEGLRWPLRGEPLEPGSTRGLSNQMIGDTASIRVDSGCVAVVVPTEESR